MGLIRYSAILVSLFLGLSAQAQSIPLNNLSSDDLNKVVGDLSVDFLHTSVSGASSLGHLFGFEVGVVGGQTSTPNLNQVANQTGTANAGKLYNADILGVLTIPLGLSAEVGVLPKQGSSGFAFSAFSAAAKWTITDLISLPVSLAGKLSYTTDSLSFNGTVSGSPVDYSYTNTETAFTGFISKDLVFIEPYFGLGYVSATGNLSANAAIFNSGFTTATSASASRTGVLWIVGTEVKLLFVKLGLEYMSMFSTSRVDGKLSFFF